MEQIEGLDRALFLRLNEIHSPFWDAIMWHLSGKFEWIPLYLLLLLLLVKKFKKNSWKPLIFVVFAIVIADQGSVQLFKNVFERYRPCHNLEIENFVHLVNNKCGGKFGFISSHASNTFALATLIGLFLKSRFNYILPLLILWATIVSYSRIYLGVHYPADVLGGALFGTFSAYVLFRIYQQIVESKHA